MKAYRFMLDTNILSDLIRHPSGAAARRIEEYGQAAVCTSIVVACELRFGAHKKASRLLTTRVEDLLERLEVLPLTKGADVRYAVVRSHLERNGTPIGPNDLLIASHALALGLSLVTTNLAEFSRVPGLNVTNWLST